MNDYTGPPPQVTTTSTTQPVIPPLPALLPHTGASDILGVLLIVAAVLLMIGLGLYHRGARG